MSPLAQQDINSTWTGNSTSINNYEYFVLARRFISLNIAGLPHAVLTSRVGRTIALNRARENGCFTELCVLRYTPCYFKRNFRFI